MNWHFFGDAGFLLLETSKPPQKLRGKKTQEKTKVPREFVRILGQEGPTGPTGPTCRRCAGFLPGLAPLFVQHTLPAELIKHLPGGAFL